MSFSTNFVPSSQVISNITNANPGVVTTVADHGYSSGLFVRLLVPIVWGMQQVTGNVYTINVLSNNTFDIGVDTSNFDSFGPGSIKQSPQVIPVGSIAKTVLEPEKNNDNIIPET